MARAKKERGLEITSRKKTYLLIGAVWVFALYAIFFSPIFATHYSRADEESSKQEKDEKKDSTRGVAKAAKLDTKAYDAKLLQVANYASTTSTTTPRLWPVKTPYPKAGALLPFNRIVAYYGNFYSTRMGVLGEYPEPQMIAMLRGEKAKWEAADPSTPVVMAINYIAMTAQPTPGADGMYRFRMPDEHIQRAIRIANDIGGIVILDIQVGHSTVQKELAFLEPYLKLPNVHLALDPEFSMKSGDVPGTVIGSFDAADINYTSDFLAHLVKEHDLPPKVLVIHRFTGNMVTNTSGIQHIPEVQVVMDMDGWGPPAKKLNTYQQHIATKPVEFTGFKLFYKNDLKPPSTRLLTPEELLKLTPRPLFIQYQ